MAASGGGSVVCRAWYSSLRSSNLSKFGLESPMLSIYIYMLRDNTVQHTFVYSSNMSLDVHGNILDQQALSLD